MSGSKKVLFPAVAILDDPLDEARLFFLGEWWGSGENCLSVGDQQGSDQAAKHAGGIIGLDDCSREQRDSTLNNW
ncbi:hypothetical protein G7066_10785 [Leucobacter coleopterorum]|uniref:Uncharacterized protein n=1 Tax=Leucobacter coleopterorum TaxID=2714933 RepID=A0ABX6JYC6_9MICO|nr:hypothetical protein [Leucobacter coleopterorum]QIM18946.1 hypothetical protein G7066_10785 [Leucobacter coleopterorum]